MGPRTQDFEAAFAEYLGCEHVVAVSSCTAALHLSCLAAGVGPGDEVIVPSMTFVATVNAGRYCGATPIFTDIARCVDLPLYPHLEEEGARRVVTSLQKCSKPPRPAPRRPSSGFTFKGLSALLQ